MLHNKISLEQTAFTWDATKKIRTLINLLFVVKFVRIFKKRLNKKKSFNIQYVFSVNSKLEFSLAQNSTHFFIVSSRFFHSLYIPPIVIFFLLLLQLIFLLLLNFTYVVVEGVVALRLHFHFQIATMVKVTESVCARTFFLDDYVVAFCRQTLLSGWLCDVSVSEFDRYRIRRKNAHVEIYTLDDDIITSSRVARNPR